LITYVLKQHLLLLSHSKKMCNDEYWATNGGMVGRAIGRNLIAAHPCKWKNALFLPIIHSLVINPVFELMLMQIHETQTRPTLIN